MAHTSDWSPLCDALANYLTAQLSALSLAFCGLSPEMAPEPVYPSAPRVDCPRLHVRPFTSEPTPFPSLRTDWDGRVSLWYYRRQTPGENHAQKLQLDLDTIASLLTGQWDPDTVAASTEVLYGLYIQQMVVHDELRHEFDDPNLRVSVGEIVLGPQHSSRG